MAVFRTGVAGVTYSNGDKTITKSGGSWALVQSDTGISSGKVYFEVNPDYSPGGWMDIGVGPDNDANVRVGVDADSYGVQGTDGKKRNNNTTASYGTQWLTNRCIGVAIDFDAGKIWFAEENVWMGSGDPETGTGEAFSGLSGEYFAQVSFNYSNYQATLRTAAADMKFSPPAGFVAWDDAGGSGDPVSFRLVHDLYYDLSGVRFLVVLDHFYHLFAGFRKEQAHVYGLRMCIEHALYYGSMPTFRRAFPRRYTNAPHLRKVFDRLYHDMARFTVEVERGYDIRGGLRLVQELSYMIAGAGFRLEQPHHYELMEYDRFRKAFSRLYAIAGAGSVTQKPVHTVRIGGALLAGVKVINVSALREQDVIVAEVQTASQGDALLAVRWAEVEVRIGDDVYQLVVSRKPRRARTTEAADTWVITASSPAVLLDRDVLVREFEPGWASAIAAELAAPHGVSVSWEIVDWLVPADTLFATNESSLAVIDKLAWAGGGIKQSAPDGTLRIIPSYPVSVNRWGTAEPEFIISDLYDLFSHDDEGDERSGYNSFAVSNLLSANQNAWLEYVDLTGERKEIRGYDVPRVDGRRFSVSTSGGPWVSVEPMGEVEEVIEEQVELFGGVGRLSKPCYGLLSVDWRQRQLGALSYSEDGTVQAEVAGASLALVRYTTRYWRWLARNARVEDVQFVREVEDEQPA
ncbi:MAG: hypothetical protein KQH59_18460 [Desulfobulbaceae bacterium]|nr:hypothetical protein [Desulfobulbaceae bacterium]